MTTTAPGWRIREAQPDDAEGIIELLTQSISEPINNLLTESEEFSMTLEKERTFLTEQSLRADWAGFVAVTKATPHSIIGLITAEGRQRRAIRHRASIGMVVALDWRGQGIGRELLRRVIRWAKMTPGISRLELEALTRNDAAVHLYERLGFVHEGVVHRALYRDGEYLDEYIMGLLL